MGLNIYDYQLYRSFLSDLFALRKAENAIWSYGYLAQKLDLDRASVVKIMQSKRHLPAEYLPAVYKLFSLSPLESEYFALLYRLERSRSASEREECARAMETMRPLHRQKLESAQYALFSQWYYTALWSLAGFHPCTLNTDFNQLLEFKVQAQEIQEALQALLNLQLLRLSPEGMLERYEQNLTLPAQWNDQRINRYLYDSMSLSQKALQSISKEDRDISALILDFPADQLPEIKEMLAKFRKELIHKVNAMPPSNRVYQLSLQLFPLSKKTDQA